MFKIILQIATQLLPLLTKKESKSEKEIEEKQDYDAHIEEEHSKDFPIDFKQSPNYKKGINKKNEVIVLHHTAGKSFKSDLNWMLDPAAKVSAHYLIGPKGEITQLVEDQNIAWHAGKSEWKGQPNVNAFSIGVECTGDTTKAPFTDDQFEALVFLTKKLMKKYDIDAEDVVSHREISPGRKVDLDPKHFDWERFYTLIQ